MAGLTVDQQLAEHIDSCYDDPLKYVMTMFPWDEDPSICMVELDEPYKSRFNKKYGPDKWACEFLDQLGEEIRKRKFNGKTAVAPIQFSTASGHGIGKSTLVAWLILFIADTRPFSMGVVTANTGDQLRTKTWAELAKWHHLSLSSHLWEYSNNKGNMSLTRRTTNKEIKQKWRCDALTARAENSESFQGLHAANSTAYYIFDEASGIEDPIWEARLGGATDGEPMSFDFGNPTRKSGYFYENCVGQYRHRYITRSIDSRDVKITNKEYMERLRQDYGEDSDIFKVKVKGEFPAIGSLQFISDDLVREAQARVLPSNKDAPLIIGVDVARYGDNDTVIFPRLGMDAKSFPFRRFNRLDQVGVAEKVIECILDFRKIGKNVSGLFIDGGGLGVGPIDILTRLGYNPINVNFGGKSNDSRFRFKGDEMYGKLRDALPNMALPMSTELRQQLTQREYGVMDTGKIHLESKDDMKERGLDSPDIADALVLTFAQEVAPNHFMNTFGHLTNNQMAKSDYDPFKVDW